LPEQAVVPAEVAEAVGGLKELTPSGTSVLLEGQLAETPPGTKQVSSRISSLHLSHSLCAIETVVYIQAVHSSNVLPSMQQAYVIHLKR
jgi:hypothetical protein